MSMPAGPAGRSLGFRWLVVTFAVIVAAAIAGRSAADKPDDAAPKSPDTVTLDELVDLYEPVPFEHKAHADMAEMWDGCKTCHHRPPTGKAESDTPANGKPAHTQDESDHIPACKSCHPVKADNTNIRMPSLKGAYHRQCLNCHKAWTGANDCVVCHKPRKDKAGKAKPTTDDVIGRMHPPLPAPKVKEYTARYVPAAGAKVTFRHDEHVQRFGLRCVECHRSDTCASCHDPDFQAERRKPVKPAISWQTSHDPCMACHSHQSCSHCHYDAKGQAPPSFEHRMTGQLLDHDHAELPCRSCHGDVSFTALPTCGDAACHEGKRFSYPDRRPGKRIAATLPQVLRHTKPVAPPAHVGNGRDAETHATTTIATTTTAPPIKRTAPRMTTVERPTRPTKSCVTEECHVAVKSYKVVHGPVGGDACDVCHKAVDQKKHTFTVVREREALCTYCHQFSVEAMPVVHSPTERGECLGCHNPHGGRDASLTREDSTEKLCNRCHDSVTSHRAFLHTPVGDGDCVSCHPPHAARFPKLLDAAGPDLCIACHDEFGKQLGDAKFTHKAIKEGCTRCHNVHGSAFPEALVAPAPDLCLECHDKTKAELAAATHKHSPVTAGESCMNCHTPHGGNVATLMRDRSAAVCLTCHDKAITTNDNRTIAAVSHVFDDDRTKHGPIAEGECRGCHTSHGGTQAQLLVANYTDDDYAAFDPKQFALCFTCHDEQLALERAIGEGDSAPTSFRNGEMNLHYLHVNKRYGRTCRVCHETHTSTGDRLLRDRVPYGKWEAPLKFTRTETGGRCVTGCHLPFSYDRQNPIDLPAQREVNEQAQRVRADVQQATKLAWQAKDIAGKPVAIPAKAKATLLLVVHADGKSDIAAVRAVRQAAVANDDVQVVLAVMGEQAADRAKAISEAADPAWQTVVVSADQPLDVDAKASTVALVIRPDGRVLARVGGTPSLLVFTLQTYVDLAVRGELQPAAGVVANGSAKHSGVEPSQYLRTARQLVATGQFRHAEQTLREAIKLHPDATELQTMLVGVLVEQGQAKGAMELLDRLPADAKDAPERVLLRARANIALGEWDEALKQVQLVLATAPAEKRAQYLLGVIHEHRGEWQKAAEAFRAAHTDQP